MNDRKTVGIEEGLRMIRGIAGLILSNLNLDDEDTRAGAEAIWEIVCRIEEDPEIFLPYRPSRAHEPTGDRPQSRGACPGECQ